MPLDDNLMKKLEAAQPVKAKAASSRIAAPDLFKPNPSCYCTGNCNSTCMYSCSRNKS